MADAPALVLHDSVCAFTLVFWVVSGRWATRLNRAVVLGDERAHAYRKAV